MGEQLCSACSQLDLSQYFQRETHVKRNRNFIGPSTDALMFKSWLNFCHSSKFCDFCKLILESLRKRWEPESWMQPDIYLQLQSRQPEVTGLHLFSYMYAEDKRTPDDTDSLAHRAFRLGIGLRAPSEDYRVLLDCAGELQLLHTSCESLGLYPTFHGRTLDPRRANIELAKQWLEECETNHQQRCKTQSQSNSTVSTSDLETLRVIDVERMCLVTIGGDDRYITLSYRWEYSEEDFKTTKQNVGDRQIANSLQICFSRLPETIQDTIECTRRLGERFLWIDAICIVQDCEDEFARLIPQMGLIYGNSFVTIVSAPPPPNGSSSPEFKGLPGYRGRQNMYLPSTGRIHGLNVSTPFLSVKYMTLMSPWQSRAWTFQEELLSQRRLYFTSGQLYFQCTCGVFCEDAVGEGKSPSAQIACYKSLCNLSSPNVGENMPAAFKGGIYRDIIPDLSLAWLYYQDLVHRYTGKHLTFQNDVLKVFEGILSIMTQTMNTEFIHGLPEIFFNEAILWMTFEISRRRTSHEEKGSAELFPTWTWAGWQNSAGYFEDLIGFIRSEIDWYVVTHEGEVCQLSPKGHRSPSEPPFIEENHRDVRPPIELPEEFVISSLSFAQLSRRDTKTCSLACSSNIASFQFLGNTIKPDEVDELCAKKHHTHFIISNAQCSAVGAILLEKSWSDRIREQSFFEFMLLSRSSECRTSVPLDEHIFKTGDWCFLNVMLVKREENNVERLGIGAIHEDAWMEANPLPMLLYLR